MIRMMKKTRMMKMGLFDIFKRQPHPGRDIPQEERDAGGETNALRLSLKRVKADLEIQRAKLEAERDRLRLEAEIERAKQDLEDLQADSEDDDDGGGSSIEDTMMTALLTKVLAGQQPQPVAPQPVIAPRPVDLGDQQIQQVWDNLSPTHKKLAVKMPDDTLKAVIAGNMPSISEEGLNKAVAFVRKQKV